MVIRNFGKNLTFSDKSLVSSNIVLKERDVLITNNHKLANFFSTYFINIIDTLQLKKSPLKFQSLSNIFLFIKITTVFLKSNKAIFQNNFVSKRYHQMKLKRL